MRVRLETYAFAEIGGAASHPRAGLGTARRAQDRGWRSAHSLGLTRTPV